MDYTQGNGTVAPNTRFNEYSLKTQLGLNSKLGLFRLYYDYNQPKYGLLVDAAVPLITANSRENEVWYQNLNSHLLSTRNTLFFGPVKVDVNGAYQSNSRQLKTTPASPFFTAADMTLNTLSYEVKSYLPAGKLSDLIVGVQGATVENINHEAPNQVIPDAKVNDLSLFSLIQSNPVDALKIQAGARYDFRNITTSNDAALNKHYGNISASAGATYNVSDMILVRTNFASAYRTPNLAELTQDGVHGTRYEQGNTELQSQRNYEIDLSAHYHSDLIFLDVSVFNNRINNYIYIAPTNEYTENDLQIFRYSQSDATIKGAEITFNIQAASQLQVESSYSYLIGERSNGDPLPYIPQNKIRLSASYHPGNFFKSIKAPALNIGGLYAFSQDRPAMFETGTDHYLVLNASISGDLHIQQQPVSIALKVNNLFDELYVDHLSTLKEMGYYNMGRNISIQLRIPFKTQIH